MNQAEFEKYLREQLEDAEVNEVPKELSWEQLSPAILAGVASRKKVRQNGLRRKGVVLLLLLLLLGPCESGKWEVGSRKGGDWGTWRLGDLETWREGEVGSGKSEVGSRKSEGGEGVTGRLGEGVTGEVGSRKSEVGNRKWEGREGVTGRRGEGVTGRLGEGVTGEVGSRKAEGGRRKAEEGGNPKESFNQKKEVVIPESKTITGDHSPSSQAPEPWTMDHGLWTMDYGPWTMDYGLWTMDYGLWTMDHGLWTTPPLSRRTLAPTFAERTIPDLPPVAPQAVVPAAGTGSHWELMWLAGINTFSPNYQKENQETPYFGAYEQSLTGWQAGLRLQREGKGGWTFAGGLEFSRLRYRFERRRLDSIDLYRPNTLDTIYYFSRTNDSVLVFRDTVPGLRSSYARTFNDHRSLAIPLLLGYQWAGKKLGLRLQTGLNLHLWRQSKGWTAAGEGPLLQLEPDGPYRTGFSLGLLLEAQLRYSLNAHWTLISNVQLEQAASNWIRQESLGFQQQPRIVRMGIGLSRRF